MNYFLELICRFVYFLFSYKRYKRISGIKEKLYTLWIKHSFGACGNNCIIGKFRKLENPQLIYIGKNVIIGHKTVIELYTSYQNQRFDPSLKIGDNSSIGDNSHISCINKICIGNNVRIGRKVFITDNSHGSSRRCELDIAPNKRDLSTRGEVTIEDNVWIGEMVCILPGIKIGKGTIIGANAVVTKDLPSYCVAVGNPAKVIKLL